MVKKPPPPADRPEEDDEPDPYDYERIFLEAQLPDPPLLERIGKKQIKKAAIGLVALIILLIIAVSTLRQFDPKGPSFGEVTVEIPKGATTSQIADTLQTKGVIPSSIGFRIWVKTHGDATFQAGEYTFEANSAASQALGVLEKGPKAKTDKLVIPEGKRVAQIAELVGRLPGMSAAKFMELVNSGKYQSEYQPPNSKSLEGVLFPDTYTISAGDDEESLLRRMINQFGQEAALTGLSDSESKIAQTPYETLIIASLIEAEAKTDEDRGKISQVIQNRLFKVMPLQIDATVLYALGNTKSSLSNADLKIKSDYNTYAKTGLPSGPICNPGAESIQAALEPTPGPWLFYVTSGLKDGSHLFATTYEEHLENIKKAQATAKQQQGEAK